MTSTVSSPMPTLSAVSNGTQLRKVFGRFPSGVVAVCADVDGAPVGMLVSSFTSVSLEPALASVCVMESSRSWSLLRRAQSCSPKPARGWTARSTTKSPQVITPSSC
jgi:flavin reductase (DIM6/NTAB) family NADH-FMN oxidoreductase RutF